MYTRRIGIVTGSLIAALGCSASGQTPSWIKQATFPTGRDLHGVGVLPSGEAWAVGLSGAIVHRAGACARWLPQTSGTVEPLMAVKFTDALHGVAVGNVRLYTFNGGATWTQSAGPPFGTLEAIDFTDAARGWACGSFGVMLNTVDGGITWTPQSIGSTAHLADIDFVDAQRGWAVGADGVIVSTTNGGRTWVNQASGTSMGLGTVSFINANEGWAAGTGVTPVLLHTINGGNLWQPISIPAQVQPLDIHFRDSLHGWTCGFNQGIFETADGGHSWQGRLCPDGYPADLTCEYVLNDIAFANGSSADGIAVGAGGSLFATGDAGQSWSNAQSGSDTYVNRLFALDTARAWAGNSGDVILRTTDGGLHWSRSNTGLSLTNAERTTGLEFVDALHGFACANIGDYIVKSDDGGVTWTPSAQGTGTPTSDLDALDADNIVVCGAGFPNAFINVTHDGGDSWAFATVFPSTAVGEYYSIRYITSQIVFATAGTAGVYRSMDGGETFHAIAVPGSNALFSIATIGGAHVWIVDIDSDWQPGIMRSIDGGQTWTRHALPGGIGTTLQAVSTSVLWSTGNDGRTARSLDGGITWVLETINAPELTTSTTLTAVAFVNADQGWVGGDSVNPDGSLGDGVIYRRGASPISTPDINGDGQVNVNDLLAVITAWGPCASPCPPRCVADISPNPGGDCSVDVNDLLAIVTAWGSCP